jgi:hypothetical protein
MMNTATLIFPTKEPDEVLDYQIDATAKIADSADMITGVSVSIAPFGTGELTTSRIAVNGSFITLWLSGGLPARIYQINVKVVTNAQRQYEWLIVAPISADLAVYPIRPPPYASFGPSITWSA